MKPTKYQIIFLRPEMVVVEATKPITAERWANQIIKRKAQEDKELWTLLSIEPLKS